MPPTLPDGSSWPKISVVTPSYNQGKFIEETIRSVLLQGYPNLEYFVFDGGSTDSSVEIIKKYEKWLTYWVSEPDKGQANAINKGLERATGEIAAYLNSDDLYLPGALQHIAQTYRKTGFDVFVGKRKSKLLCRPRMFIYPFIFEEKCRYELPQECVFWNHAKYKSLRFNEQFHFCLDVWWFDQIYSGAQVVHSSKEIGFFREHEQSKSSRLQELAKTEIQQIVAELLPSADPVPDEAKEKIVSAYKQASLLAFGSHLLMPWKDSLFQYHHPAYLKETKTGGNHS